MEGMGNFWQDSAQFHICRSAHSLSEVKRPISDMGSKPKIDDSFYAPARTYFCASGFDTSPCSPSSLSVSTLSSPLESELGSTESESDVDGEYVAELTRQMALFMFQDDDDAASSNELEHDFNDPSSRFCQEDRKVKGLKLDGEKQKARSRGSSESSSPLPPSSILPNSRSSLNGVESDFLSKQVLIEDQIRNAKFAQKFTENQKGRRKKNNTHRKGNKQMELSKQIRQVELEKKALQQRSESKQGVLPSEFSSKNGSVGTGVFLPRRGVYDHDHGPRSKSGRPTVLIPARVIQALRLHFDKVGVSSLPSAAVSIIQNDGVIGDVICGLDVGEDDGEPPNPGRSPEKLLPQEWTY